MPSIRLGFIIATSLRSVRGLSVGTATSAVGANYDKLKNLLRDINALSEVNGILSYDEQCFMPPGAAASRAAQKAALAKVIHQARTGTDMQAAIDAVRGCEDELDDPKARANVRDAVDAFDKEARKSAKLAEAEAKLESEAFGAWKEARGASDFSVFAPKLDELFKLKKEVARITRPAVAEPCAQRNRNGLAKSNRTAAFSSESCPPTLGCRPQWQ
eukprot:2778828-Prymnesium_polylepis.2